ncbi:hypothetical protein BDW59DRAFT_180748 [Aspergillus cavernicola]|uniref:Uncharacterized protein n=1 Tax=Aspergillus cavernicola TaxID=176166 RepID=A0ABR4I8S6_9EURO
MTATTVTKNSIYRLGSLFIGKAITVPSAPSPAANISQTEWTLQPGVYTPRQIVQGFAPLLDIVLHHLTPDASAPPARTQLLDNIAAILSTDTRESSLPFPAEVPDHSRREIRDQARRVGQDLVQWANNTTDDYLKADLVLRSRCEGHLLVPENVDLMFGRRSKPHLMQLFNEYMHQMVLLRDSLLPFHNYEEVLIPVSGKGRGLRHMEGQREKFMAGLFTKQVTQASVIEIARGLLAPNLPRTATGGYGFQYAHGLVIPALFTDGPAPLHLLQYVPARVDPDREDLLLEYEFPEYYAAPRVEIPAGKVVDTLASYPETSPPIVEKSSLGLRPDSAAEAIGQLDLRLEFSNGKCVAVDLGQIGRGHRFGYDAKGEGEVDVPSIVHAAHEVLLDSEPGLITAQAGGFHVIPVEEKIVALAVLGKLYPENVVRLSKEDGLEKTVKAGKGFEPKFVVWA